MENPPPRENHTFGQYVYIETPDAETLTKWMTGEVRTIDIHAHTRADIQMLVDTFENTPNLHAIEVKGNLEEVALQLLVVHLDKLPSIRSIRVWCPTASHETVEAVCTVINKTPSIHGFEIQGVVGDDRWALSIAVTINQLYHNFKKAGMRKPVLDVIVHSECAGILLGVLGLSNMCVPQYDLRRPIQMSKLCIDHFEVAPYLYAIPPSDRRPTVGNLPIYLLDLVVTVYLVDGNKFNFPEDEVVVMHGENFMGVLENGEIVL